MEKKALIVDTSSAIYVVKNKINLELAVRMASPDLYPVIPRCVMNELRGLSVKNTEAKVALSLFSGIEVVETEGKGDSCIVELARKTGWPVLTNDRELTRELKSHNIRVFLVKEHRYLGEAR